jgi:hypothetical protein
VLSRNVTWEQETQTHSTVEPYFFLRTEPLPNYGKNERPEDLVPDWFLGGNRRRRLLAALAAADQPVSVEHLRREVQCGRNTAFETVRALDALGLIKRPSRGHVQLTDDVPLSAALRGLLTALRPFDNETVHRQHRSRGPT